MAAFDTTATSGTGRFGGLFALTHRFTSALTNWNDARITRNALSGLTDRELEDIGLVRGDINDLAVRTH
ncbi:MAG: DUF1127 domain-containing protein [Pseudomonadota bacterium]